MFESFADDIEKEGQLFGDDEQEKDNSEGSQPEEKPKGETPAEETKQTEENVPFHKHPRFQEIIRKNKELEEEMAQLRQATENINKPNQSTEIPKWFVDLFGENEQPVS